MRTMELAVPAGLWAQTFAFEEPLYQVEPAEPRSDAQIKWRDYRLAETLGQHAMAPEQRDRKRRAAVAIRFRERRSAGLEQKLQRRERAVRIARRVGVSGLMQRGPALVVRQIRVGIGGEQVLHHRGAAE